MGSSEVTRRTTPNGSNLTDKEVQEWTLSLRAKENARERMR